MKEINMLNRLELEHGQLLRKLNFLELQYLEMCRGDTPDYSLMRNIIIFVQEYPEQIHHPLEDMIFSILLERVDDVGSVQELISEHTHLETVTRELRDSLDSISSGTVDTEKLKQQLSTFLVAQRKHIYTEETEVYPLVKSALTEGDWERLEKMVPIIDEPIYGKRTRYDYERLSRDIEDKNMMRMLGDGNEKLISAKINFSQFVNYITE